MTLTESLCVGGRGGGGPEQPAAGLGDAGGGQDCLLQAEGGTRATGRGSGSAMDPHYFLEVGSGSALGVKSWRSPRLLTSSRRRYLYESNWFQCRGSGSGMDPHYFWKLDPDPHWSD
jgi:hypothetical protein